MESAAVYVLGLFGVVFTAGVVLLRLYRVPLEEQVETVKEIGSVVGPTVIALLAYLRANQATAKAEDNRQAIGVVARVAVDGFAGPPVAKLEAVKNLNGTLPAPGSDAAKRPDVKETPC